MGDSRRACCNGRHQRGDTTRDAARGSQASRAQDVHDGNGNGEGAEGNERPRKSPGVQLGGHSRTSALVGRPGQPPDARDEYKAGYGLDGGSCAAARSRLRLGYA